MHAAELGDVICYSGGGGKWTNCTGDQSAQQTHEDEEQES